MLDLNKETREFSKYDKLSVVLGKWHDRQVVIRHLEKITKAGNLSPEQVMQFKKIETKLSSERKQLFTRITKAIHKYKPL